jgi:predicted SAM-dependent methyltransferase
MTNLLRPFLFAKALYLDRRQRKRIESLEEETVAKVDQLLNDNIPIYLELGHSHLQANDWLTLDQNLNCDFYWDYRNGLSFPEGSIDVLFSRNTLQRLSSQQLDYLLKDCFRVLKPGGAFFLSVPDAEPVLRAYAEKHRHFEAHPEAIWRPGWHETGSCMDQVIYTAYCNGHAQFMFDRENVVNLCWKAGFAPAELRSPDAKIDGAPTDPHALYVLARKPA